MRASHGCARSTTSRKRVAAAARRSSAWIACARPARIASGPWPKPGRARLPEAVLEHQAVAPQGDALRAQPLELRHVLARRAIDHPAVHRVVAERRGLVVACAARSPGLLLLLH